jgi:hypothetical protein
MNLKKLGQIAEVNNSSCFHAVPNQGLLIRLQYKKVKNSKGKYQNTSELTFYKNFNPIKVIPFDAIGVLEKFRDRQTYLIFITATQLYLIDIHTFNIEARAFQGQITAKIDDYYLINGSFLTQFHTNYHLELEKSVYLNLQYHIQVPSKYIYGYNKVSTKAVGQIEATSMECFSIQTGKSLWSYENASEISFIGNTAKQLWLFLSNRQVAVLDIQTGHELTFIGHPNWNKTNSTTEAAAHSILGRCHLDKSKVIALGEQHYQEVSMKTFQLKHIELRAEFDKYAISAMYACYDHNNIYFYDSDWIGSHPRGKVAILDRKTLKIRWCWDMLKELGTAPLHIEVVDNQLYVLDNGLILHVFEVSN